MARVTIMDVAHRAGVSKTAVSFAFNDPSRLSSQNVRHILEVAKELGYAPHPIARGLNTGRVGAIGLLLPQDLSTDFDNPFYVQLLRGIGHVCDEHALNLMMLAPVGGSMREAVDRAVVDGLVVIGLEADDPLVELLSKRAVPFVMLDTLAEGVPSVSVDDFGGAQEAMRHVLDLGHRQVGIVAFESSRQGHWQEYTGTLRRRMDGYLRALASAGLPTVDVPFCEVENSTEGGEHALRTLLSEAPDITAVLAMSDVIALGILQAAADMGVAVPERLSVVGYDDVPEAEHSRPPLTSVHQPIVEKGEAAAEALVSMLTRQQPVSTTLPTHLVVRASTGPAPREP